MNYCRNNYGRRWYDLTRSACIVGMGLAACSGALAGAVVTYLVMR